MKVKIFIFGMFYSLNIFASKGGTVADDIMTQYRSSKHFHQFIQKLTKKTLPGDQRYIWKMINSSKDLRNSYELPKITFENGTFTVRDGKSEATLLFVDREYYEFEVNREKVKLPPHFEPSARWKKVSALIAAGANKQSLHFSLLPIAWAQEAGLPTKTAVTLFAMSSRISKYSSSVMGTRIGSATYLDLLNVASKSEGKCSKKMLVEYGQKMADLNPTEIMCEGHKGMVGFKFTGDEGYERNIYFSPANNLHDDDRIIEEFGSGKKPEKVFQYVRSKEIPHEEQTGYDDESVAEKSSPYQRDLAGADSRPWIPVSSKDPQAMERGEMYKELANYAFKHDICQSCKEVLRGFAKTKERDSKKPIPAPQSGVDQ